MLEGSKQIALALIILAMLPSAIQASAQQILELKPADDSYVVSDLNDPLDKLGFMDLNAGDFKFLKTWYAWNVTEAGTERILSLIYLKFDLSNLEADSINSAELQMYAFVANLTGVTRPVDLHVVPNSDWIQSSLTFNSAPVFNPNATASTIIQSNNKWYTWDLTDEVKENAGSQLSAALVLRTLYQNSEEQVVFHSKESNERDKAPKLVMALVGSSSVGMSQDTILAIIAGSAAAAGGFAFYLFQKKRKLKLRNLQT